MSEQRPSSKLLAGGLSGARWTASGRFVAEIAGFASSVVLARLIAPAEFGHAAVALIVVALAAVLGTAGLAAPLVQRRDLGRHHVASATFLALVAGVLMTAVTAGFGVAFAPALFGGQTADLTVAAAPVWLIVGAGAASQALLQRELRFRRYALIEGTSVLVGASTSVFLAAVAGLDGEALVAGALASASCLSLLAVVSAPPGMPIPNRQGVDDVWRFAAPVAGSSLVYLGYRHVDYAILGAQAPAAQVGYYWRAYQLGVGYQSKVSRVMLRISLPLFSRAIDMDEVRMLRKRIVRVHATVLVPTLAAFIAFAPVLVPWLFGSAWEPAVLPAQIIAVAGMAEAITTGIGPLMVALGRAKALLRWNLGVFAVYAVIVAVVAPYGIVAVAIAVAAFGAVSVLGVQLILMGPQVGLTIRDLWGDVRGALVSGAAVLAALVGVREALELLDPAPVLVLSVLSVAGLGVYGVVLRTLFPEEWADVLAVVRRRSATLDGGASPT